MNRNEKSLCGLVMPISAIDGCSESHWADVLSIISEAVLDAGFEPNLVSNSDEVGVIQKRIVQNLYDNPIVVCDVSGRNPNVMFELGMRLAFDKPTIIIKDDKTTYSFDTSSIEHLEYPRDLRFTDIIEFKEKLKTKIQKTHKRSSEDQSYTTFLKHFGEFKVAKIDTKEVSSQELIMDELRSLRRSMNRLERRPSFGRFESNDIIVCLKESGEIDVDEVAPDILDIGGVKSVSAEKFGDHYHLEVETAKDCIETEIVSSIKKMLPDSRVRVAGRKRSGAPF